MCCKLKLVKRFLTCKEDEVMQLKSPNLEISEKEENKKVLVVHLRPVAEYLHAVTLEQFSE